jgi:hypothetical protein
MLLEVWEKKSNTISKPSSDPGFVLVEILAETPFQVFFFMLNDVFLNNPNEDRQYNKIPPITQDKSKAEVEQYQAQIHRIAAERINPGRLQRISRLMCNDGIA